MSSMWSLPQDAHSLYNLIPRDHLQDPRDKGPREGIVGEHGGSQGHQGRRIGSFLQEVEFCRSTW